MACRSIRSVVIVLSLLFSVQGHAQVTGTLSDADIADLVRMVDDEVELSSRQRNEMYKILKDSYTALLKIRSEELAEVEKLDRIRRNQFDTDKALQQLLTAEQYGKYRVFVHGTEQPAELPAATTYRDRIGMLADELSLEGDKRLKFIKSLETLEMRTAEILADPSREDAGINLLAAILTTDLDIIDAIGKPAYREFHRQREAGALSGTASKNETDISTVLLFHDISNALGLTADQREGIIRLVLKGEQEKQAILADYSNDPALLKEKLERHERSAIVRLQTVLTEDQTQILLQLLDR